MSYSRYYFFRDNGLPPLAFDLLNGWGSGPVVWNAIFKKYKKLHPKADEPYLTWLLHPEWLWSLPSFNIPGFRSCEDILLAATSQRALTKRENFTSLAAAIREFIKTETGNYNGVNHWPIVADKLCEMAKNESIHSFGICPTSCGEDVWCWHDEESDEMVTYDPLTMKDHIYVQDAVGATAKVYLTTWRDA